MQADLPLIRLTELSNRLPLEAVYSGRTAAWLHGLDVAPCSPVEVTLPRTSTTSRRARMSIRRSDIPQSEICRVHDLPATGPTRTVSDLGRRLPLVEGVVVIEMAFRRGITNAEQLQTWIRSHVGFPGSRRLARAIELADAMSESPMETRLRPLLVLNGLPRPIAQAQLHDRAGLFIARTDLYYPHRRLAIEYDGVSHRSSLAADNRRQNRILEAGYRLLRFTAGDIAHRHASVVAQVRRALG